MSKTFSSGNLQIHGLNEEQLRLIQARDRFVRQYCSERGWNMDELEWEQILEIRQQPGWKDPKLKNREMSGL